MPNVTLIDPQGTPRDVPEEFAQDALDRGWRNQTHTDVLNAAVRDAHEDDFGGVGGAIKASAAALGRGATLGLTDAAARLIGGEDAALELEGLREQNPGISAGFELAGAVAPSLLSGGANLPAGLASRAGRAVTTAGGGLKGAIAGGAVEGALYGAGSGVSELALSQDPLTWERATSVLSSNALFGAATGGAAGGATHLVERGLARAGAYLDERAAAKATSDAVPDDLAALDAKGLRAAADDEIARLSTTNAEQRAAAKSASVDDVLAYRRGVDEANPWLVITEGQDAAKLGKAQRLIRTALDDPKGLRENPGSLLKPLRIEEQALEGALAKRSEIAAKLEKVNAKIARELDDELATLPDKATHVELSGKAARRYSAFADVKVGKDATVRVAREDATRFAEALQAGEVAGESAKALDNLGGLLEQNRALQAQIKGAMAPLPERAALASERLTAIRAAQDVLHAPKPEASLVEKAASGGLFGVLTGAAAAVPGIGQIPGVAHLLGAKGAELVSGLVFGRIGKATGEAAARTAAAAKAFAGAVEHASKYTPVLATKALAGVRYAQRTSKEPAGETLHELFRARTDEIKSQTAYDESGTPRMRPEARLAMADTLRPIRALDPVMADRMETIAARRIEYLSSIIPRRPDWGGLPLGSSSWRPSDMEMRSFARSAAAVEDPGGVEERAVHGAITPEDVDAYWAVYPERAAHFRDLVTTEIATLQTLPYGRQIALSMLSGTPVHPSLHPEVIASLQAQFVAEPGSEGGAQAPRAMPQYGAIQTLQQQSTPAQQRAEGAHR